MLDWFCFHTIVIIRKHESINEERRTNTKITGNTKICKNIVKHEKHWKYHHNANIYKFYKIWNNITKCKKLKKKKYGNAKNIGELQNIRNMKKWNLKKISKIEKLWKIWIGGNAACTSFTPHTPVKSKVQTSFFNTNRMKAFHFILFSAKGKGNNLVWGRGFTNQSRCLLLCASNFHHALISKNKEDNCTTYTWTFF